LAWAFCCSPRCSYRACGLIVLLFKVGVESNLKDLLEQLSKAGVVWLPNIVLRGLPAYFVMRQC